MLKGSPTKVGEERVARGFGLEMERGRRPRGPHHGSPGPRRAGRAWERPAAPAPPVAHGPRAVISPPRPSLASGPTGRLPAPHLVATPERKDNTF